jgi:hypothetical protein
MVMMKKLTAYALLISFVVLLTPRGIWHHHHEGDHHSIADNHDHHDEDTKSNSFEEDCFQCDYDMDVAEHARSFKYRFANKNGYKHPETANYFVSQQKLDFDKLRGPPNA